jgi:hypothetical protein
MLTFSSLITLVSISNACEELRLTSQLAHNDCLEQPVAASTPTCLPKGADLHFLVEGARENFLAAMGEVKRI